MYRLAGSAATLTIVVALGALPAAGAQSGGCAIAPPSSGFGADGPFAAGRDSIRSPLWENRWVYVYYPLGASGPAPTVCFFPSYDGREPAEYDRLIAHVVSRGYAMVFPSMRRISFTRKELDKCAMAYEGFEEAARRFARFADTTRVAFVGHSFGAGMAPAVAHHLIGDLGWGSRGACMLLMAPWYPYALDKRGLQTFPGHVKLIVQVYDDDNVNDPRMAQYLFENFGVLAADKKFMIVYGDHRGDCRLRADDDVPLTAGSFWGRTDALDYYAVFKTFDALAECTFTNDTAAQRVALGRGDPQQRYMGQWPDGTPVHEALVTDTPAAHVPQSGFYVNSWRSLRNPVYDSRLLHKAWKVHVNNERRKWHDVLATVAAEVHRKRRGFDDPEILPNPIAHGYGADSSFDLIADSFPNPLAPNMSVYLFRPESLAGRPPVLFLTPGYSGTDPYLFEPLLDHIVSRGVAVFYSPYPLVPPPKTSRDIESKHAIAWSGYEAAMKRWGALVDTSHVGFFGQSFGGGLTPSIARAVLTDNHWGSAGAFMYLAAPWYCVDMTKAQLESFPPATKLLVEVFDDDRVNDHQMAVDIYDSIGIPDSNKDFVVLFSDSLDGYVMRADHFVPYGTRNIHGQENLLDYYGIFRLFDALADYAFTGASNGRKVALGKGSPEQRFMGEWTDGRPVRELQEIANPEARHPELQYLWAWDNAANPRRGPVLKTQERREERREDRAEEFGASGSSEPSNDESGGAAAGRQR